MASIDELASAIGAAKERIAQIRAGLSRSISLASELRDEFTGLGADDKTAAVAAVERDLEAGHRHCALLGDQAEQIQARTEALRTNDKGSGGATTPDASTARTEPEEPRRTPPGNGGSRPPGVPANWEDKIVRNRKGRIWQRPGAQGNADALRLMDPDEDYPNGYVRFYNRHNQPIRLDGKPGSNDETHIPIRDDGTYDIPQGWHSDSD